MESLNIKCKVSCCDKVVVYKNQQVCQMHYFRMMRKGTYETISELKIKEFGLSRKYRTSNPAGYQKLYEPKHKLSTQGYVYEHRKVVYSKYGDNLPNCELCNIAITWETCHVDHINNDVTDNNLSNLRPICAGCNTSRKYRGSAKSIEIDGINKSIMQWTRDDSCKVSYQTILRRLLAGYNNKDAVFSEKITHKNIISKKSIIKFNTNYEN